MVISVSDVYLLQIKMISIFITLARLSPEKNQQNLIKAFKDIVNINRNCKLFYFRRRSVIWKSKKLIRNLNLENHVYLLGFINNPYMLLDRCDCFILPSNYEGQGMSILEAQILKTGYWDECKWY